MINGIDVSKWQGKIDWNKVKAAGKKFAILRAGYGQSGKDAYFEANYRGAKAAGVHVGAYWYSYATTVAAAKAEARACLRAIRGKVFEYPIWFDQEYEPSIKRLTKQQRTDIVKAFCEELENAGYYTGLYCSRDWLTNWLYPKQLKAYDIWIAAYGQTPGNVPLPFGIWQCSSKGKVPGISGNVDLDESFKDYYKIIRATGLNGYDHADDIDAIARQVIAGVYGNGQERKDKLTAAGYDYAEVQGRVNEIMRNEYL